MAADPRTELRDVLDWACAKKVISDEDRALLASLVLEAIDVPDKRAGSRNAGLTARDLAAKVAPRFGLSPVQVRRRATRTIDALVAIADQYIA